MPTPADSIRRAIPSVEKVLQALGEQPLPRAVVVPTVRKALGKLREAGRSLAVDEIISAIRSELDAIALSRLQPVINGSGILAHTNLGRAPLARVAVAALADIATGYNNLEYDLEQGERGSRGIYVERLIALACDAEAAMVVNNCAAALVLILRHFTRERPEVVISRGELVQIGGGFRVPEILAAAGATLIEVGATNRTTIEDYERAISPRTGMILKVHQSNFYMGGFVESPNRLALATLAKANSLPLVEDLGSGALLDTTHAGLDREPQPSEALAEGASLVCFSGDKLLGGPQAGIIVGNSDLVADLKREPFFRALRADKLILAALQATMEVYLRGEEVARAELPLWRMLATSNEELTTRAQAIVTKLELTGLRASIGSGKGQVGGGTLPKYVIESVTIDVQAPALESFAARLRRGRPPVIGYIAHGLFKVDLRTVSPDQDETLPAALASAFETSR